MGETDCGGYGVLFWWAGPCSVNLKSNFLLIGGTVFPPCCLTWDQTMVEVMKTWWPPSKGPMHTLNHSVPQSYSRPLPTCISAGDSWTVTGKSRSVPYGVTAPSPGSGADFVCALQESVFPVLSKFCNQIPLGFDSKVKFPAASQSPCQIPRLGNLLWVLELSQQCKNLFGIIVLQLVGHLLGGSMEGLMETSSKRAYATPRSAASRAPDPMSGHCWPTPLQETLRHSKAGLAQSLAWCAKGFVWALWASLVDMGFDSKCIFTPPTILLWLLLSLGHVVWFWWDPTFSCWWLFSCKYNFGILKREDKHISFYSAILILMKKCLYTFVYMQKFLYSFC